MSNRGRARRLLTIAWSILWRGLSFFVAWGILMSPVVLLDDHELAHGEGMATVWFMMGIDGLAWLALLAATWIMVRFIDRRTMASIGLSMKLLPRDFAVGLLLGFVWLVVSLLLVWVGGWLVPSKQVPFVTPVLWLGALSVLLNAIVQQLLLTGYLFSLIRTRTGLLAAVLVSAVLFTAYHAPAFQGAWLPMFNVFLTGALFCLAREATGAIWLPAGMHAAWNILLGPFLALTVSGRDLIGGVWSPFALEGPAWATGGSFGIEGGLPVTGVTLLLIVSFLPALSLRQHAQAGAAPSGQV